MPGWLVKLLEEDGSMKMGERQDRHGKIRKVQYCPNQTAGVVPVLAQFLEQDESTSYAYLCDPAVKHVSKLKREGDSGSLLPMTSADVNRWILRLSKYTIVVLLYHRSEVSRTRTIRWQNSHYLRHSGIH